MKTVQAAYDKKHNKLYIETSKDEWVPKYLMYFLEYHGFPKNIIVVFIDGEINMEEIRNDTRN